MSLRNYKLSASIAVSDVAQAMEFYEGKLGLPAVEEQPDGSRIHASGGGASLHVYPSSARVGNATEATWYVSDLEQVVDELASNGVTFEHYDEPEMKTDEKEIFAFGDVKVA